MQPTCLHSGSDCHVHRPQSSDGTAQTTFLAKTLGNIGMRCIFDHGLAEIPVAALGILETLFLHFIICIIFK
ncbi:unnamed protein product [Acanthoscelides obtectus]|uniref:Uncharacterized protein n=1 Tax=Acanthoscelides obtectus TaxID=200917 RepID=A0A9P0PLI0_ACAOB|nr:unnamed protein product [Acanthoscelides obtectus]CAK1623413.1 hypothetical protein AOBTE_LOCUS1993 [Acanthoscelides obtectus]